LEVLETDGSAALLLRFQRVLETEPEPDLRSAVLRRHSGFRVLREFDVGSGCGPARVLDLVLTREGEGVSPSTAVRRVAVVPTGHGYLECALSTSWRWLEGLDPLFARFLVSVRPMAPPRT
jgi:hypothetical protein